MFIEFGGAKRLQLEAGISKIESHTNQKCNAHNSAGRDYREISNYKETHDKSEGKIIY